MKTLILALISISLFSELASARCRWTSGTSQSEPGSYVHHIGNTSGKLFDSNYSNGGGLQNYKQSIVGYSSKRPNYLFYLKSKSEGDAVVCPEVVILEEEFSNVLVLRQTFFISKDAKCTLQTPYFQYRYTIDKSQYLNINGVNVDIVSRSPATFKWQARQCD